MLHVLHILVHMHHILFIFLVESLTQESFRENDITQAVTICMQGGDTG